MATNTDKIDELSNRVAKLEAQLENVRKEAEGIATLAIRLTALQERLDNLRKETESFITLTSKVAVLEQQIRDVKEKTDETSRRRWAVIQIAVGAILGGVITLIVQMVRK